MRGLTLDNFQSLANVPLLSDRFIKVVMTGMKYTLNFLINLDWIGSVLQFVTLLPLSCFAHKTLIPD